MRGAYKFSWFTVWFVVLGAALTWGLPLGHAQDTKKVEPPEGLTKVSPTVPMPTFSLPGLNGDAFNSSALQDQVVVVRFWATW